MALSIFATNFLEDAAVKFIDSIDVIFQNINIIKPNYSELSSQKSCGRNRLLIKLVFLFRCFNLRCGSAPVVIAFASP